MKQRGAFPMRRISKLVKNNLSFMNFPFIEDVRMISSSIKNRYVILCTYVVYNNTYILHSSRTYGKIIFRASRQIHKYVMLWDDPFIVLEAQHLQIKKQGVGVFFSRCMVRWNFLHKSVIAPYEICDTI